MFIVNQIEADGNAEIITADGKIVHSNLSGNQYVDSAWVSTTYSSQGKTANRVLVLLGETTHREAFYVAISRAKQALTLYTVGREELMRLAQASRAKENVSDYVTLFEQVGEYEQRPQQVESVGSNLNYRAIGVRIGNCIPDQLATTASRNSSDYPTGAAPGARRGGFERGLGDLAATLEQCLEPLSGAVADYRGQQELLRCAGELANAATVINHGLEQMEQSAQERTRFAAAVDRVLKALGEQARRSLLTQEPSVNPLRPSGQVVRGVSIGAGRSLKPDHAVINASHNPYRQLWQQYAQAVSSSDLAKLDILVSHRAFKAGHRRKEIALMLAAGSPRVRQIVREQGKEKARAYANRVAQVVWLESQTGNPVHHKSGDKHLELND